MASLFLIALLPRLVLALYVAIAREGALYLDDRSYLRLISEHATGSTSNWDDYTNWLWDASRGFLTPGSLLFEVFGPHPALVLPLSALMGSLLVIGSFQLMRLRASHQASFVMAGLLALMPSQILWSSLFLKDIYVAFALMLIALLAQKAEGLRSRIGATSLMVLAVIVLLVVSKIRVHTFLTTCFALGLALILSRTNWRIITLVLGVGFCSIIPWMATGDIAGVNVLRRLANGMEEQRYAGAVGAATAVVSQTRPVDTTLALPNNGSSGAKDPAGTATSSGFRRILNDLRYLPAGFRVMVFDPLPQDLHKSRSLYPPFAEHVIWYPVIALAGFGLVKTRRRTLTFTFQLFLLGGLIAMWGLIEGNFGTAFRHRTEFVWLVFIFAAGGLDALRTRLNAVNPVDKEPRLSTPIGGRGGT